LREEDLLNIANWQKSYDEPVEIPYHPARVLMQDFTGVPAVVDLAAMRDAVKAMGGNPENVNPLVPVDLEHLGKIVITAADGGKTVAYPDTLVRLDSHTTMIDGVGVMGWGVGGIEAEAVMLGQPYYMSIPEVIGVRFTGELQPGGSGGSLHPRERSFLHR
jgi:aconitase A